MAKLNSNQLFIVSLVGMIGIIIMVCMGHNGNLIRAFIGLNVVAFGIGGTKIIKEVRGGKKEE